MQQEFQNRERQRTQAARLKRDEGQKGDAQDAQIISMIETIGQLDLIEGGEWDFHGISSGAVFLRRMKEHFRGLLGHETRPPFLPRPPRQANNMFSLDSPRSNNSLPWDVPQLPDVYQLPPKETAHSLCYYSINCATCLLRILHVPSFYEMVDKLYDKSPDSFSVEDNRALGLLYSVMALGCMYKTSPDDGTDRPSYKAAMEEG